MIVDLFFVLHKKTFCIKQLVLGGTYVNVLKKKNARDLRLGNAKDHIAGKFYGHLQMHYAAKKNCELCMDFMARH